MRSKLHSTEKWYWHRMWEKGLLRMWLRYKEPEYGTRGFSTQLEIALGKKTAPGFRIHFGDRGSETPIDAMISFYWIAFFWGMHTRNLGRICETLGRGHKRDISLVFHDGAMWWKLWFDDDNGYDNHHRCDGWRRPKLWPWSKGRNKYRPWMCLRHGNIDLNPLNVIWGKRYYEYRDVARKVVRVHIREFEGDSYDVTFTLRRAIQRREHGPKWVRHATDRGYFGEWECKEGIPWRNHDWKGDCSYASSFRLADYTPDKDWVLLMCNKLVEETKADRRRYGYVPRVES